MISKLLDHPITIPILKILSKKPLSIPQILNSIGKDTDISTVFAIIGELYHFGLIEQFKTAEKDESIQRPKKAEILPEFVEKSVLKAHNTTLGLPLQDYISLWEDIQQHPNQRDFGELDNWIYTVPDHLAKIFISCTPEEIRLKILNPSS
ncbi:MAG: hypothetical protein ACFE95_21245 [Candidatus Hodarchaeota archaeon]